MCEYLTPPDSNDFSERPATESGPILQRDGERRFPGIDRILDRHVPSLAARRRAEPIDGAAARADERRGDLPLLQQRDDAIDRVAFGDAAEIELDARLIERDCLRGRIQDDVGGADVAPGRGELVVGRHAAFAAEEPPRLHQRARP